MSVGVAIVGSGIFAREQHLPAVVASKDLSLKAIYSRSLKSAQGLAEGTDAGLYSEDSGAGKGYDDLLARQDVVAVVIALPILVQPEFIRKALSAGKHVISEKPIAKDIATAQELLQWYHSNVDTKKVLWAVAENFRFYNSFTFAAEQVKKLGRIQNFRVNLHVSVKPDSKYYQTEWRKTPGYQGGFVLDGGIHSVAGLRLILGQDPVATLSAHSTLITPRLPPIDTVDAIMKTQNGAPGIFSVSFGSQFNDNGFEFACEKGVVAVSRGAVTVNGEKTETDDRSNGVAAEIDAWAASIVKGEPLDPRQTAEEGLADLEILEQMLQSGEKDGEKVKLQLQVK
ncbi:hypothetical protein FQN54_008003 [Arachnomyces sp. PD_36]|nr:hypothetical protein FQN54_008003 [Arachnomyces sp. PD_36]